MDGHTGHDKTDVLDSQRLDCSTKSDMCSWIFVGEEGDLDNGDGKRVCLFVECYFE